MADKPKCPWVEAKNDADRKAAVISNPELRHTYTAALAIYNSLTDAEKSGAAAATSTPKPE